MNHTDITIGSRIRAARLIQGYTIEQLHDMTSIPVDELKNFENDKWTPPLSTVIKLQQPLRCSIGWLLCSQDADPPTSPVESELLTRFRQLNEAEQRMIFDTVLMLSEQKTGASKSFYETYKSNSCRRGQEM